MYSPPFSVSDLALNQLMDLGGGNPGLKPNKDFWLYRYLGQCKRKPENIRLKTVS